MKEDRPMNAEQVAEALGIPPDELADIFRAQAAADLRTLAQQIQDGQTLVDVGELRATRLLMLAEEFEDAWDRLHPEDDASAARSESSREANLDNDTEASGADAVAQPTAGHE
jgi:hypothetical protein